MDDVAAHAAALAFERRHTGRAAAETVEHPLGVAFSEPALPDAHMLNVLWVTAPQADAAAVLAAAEHLQGTLAHRKAFVVDEALGRALAPGIRAAGWSAEREVVMALRRPRDRPPDAGPAAEADEATMLAAEAATDREAIYGGDAEVVRQVAGARAALRAAASGRGFVATVDGAPAAHATLFSDGPIAQVEAVMTLEAHRRRGLARAVVSAAVDAALVAGPELVFLVADADDFPRELYAKLGFDPVGELWAFTRVGPEAGPPAPQRSASTRRPPA